MSDAGTPSCRVGIVGAGPFGLAFGSLLARAGRSVTIWSQDSAVVEGINKHHRSERLPGYELPVGLEAVSDGGEFADRSRFLVLAISSESAQIRLRALGEVVSSGHIAVHAIGAFAPEGDRGVCKLIVEETPILRCGVIAGPSMAGDIAAGRSTSLLCASEFDEVTREARRLLSVPELMRMYRSRDVIGAELASALSGAYTIAVGLADALDVGIGIRAVLITRAISEMTRLGTALGGEPKTFAGLAGLGNLLVRSSVEEGRTSPGYALGRSLVVGPAEAGGEGARAAMAGLRLARSKGLVLPILEAIVAVLSGEMSAKLAAVEIFKSVSEEE